MAFSLPFLKWSGVYLSVFCFVVLWGKFIAGLSGEASWRGLLGEYSTTTTVTDDDLEEEEEAKFEDATDDIHDDESLGLLPIEEGANVFI